MFMVILFKNDNIQNIFIQNIFYELCHIITDTYCYYDRENYSFEAFHISFFVSSFALPVVYTSLLPLKESSSSTSFKLDSYLYIEYQ